MPGGDLAGCDLAGADLAGAELAGADLSGAILTGADLTGADLRKAALVGADLTDATLTDAALTGAVLDRTDLSGATGLSDPALAALLGTDDAGLPWALSVGEIRLEDRDAVLAAAGAVCTGGTLALAPPGGVAVAGFHPIVAVDASGRPDDWSDGPVEAGWEPMATRFTDLVACVGDEQEEAVEECAYSGGSPITRYVHWRDVRVLAADSGAEVWSGRVEGSSPGPCPASAPVDQTRVDGGSAGFADATETIRALVTPPADAP